MPRFMPKDHSATRCLGMDTPSVCKGIAPKPLVVQLVGAPGASPDGSPFANAVHKQKGYPKVPRKPTQLLSLFLSIPRHKAFRAPTCQLARLRPIAMRGRCLLTLDCCQCFCHG